MSEETNPIAGAKEFWINIQPDGNRYVYEYKPEFETTGYIVYVREVLPGPSALEVQMMKALAEAVREIEYMKDAGYGIGARDTWLTALAAYRAKYGNGG
jgi:hypothetical protein